MAAIAAGRPSTAAPSRALTALLCALTLGAIGWQAFATLPQARSTPGFPTLYFLFSAALGAPYAVALALLGRGSGRDGLRLAAGAALVNGLWALPLAALLALFGGFTMGNRDQIHAIAAVALGAAAQLPLLAAAALGLRATALAGPASGRGEERRLVGWPAAIALPLAFSGASWLALSRGTEALRARGARAVDNQAAAEQAVRALQTCLALAAGDRGYPATLGACGGATGTVSATGFRVEYLPALPAADGSIGSYFLCATPLRFGATGFAAIVADPSGLRTAGAMEGAPPGRPPSCASALTPERAIAYCAYAFAAAEPTRGYPSRLADVAACAAEGRRGRAAVDDRLRTDDGEDYAYLAARPGTEGRVTAFRVYRLRGPSVASPWIDDQGRASPAAPSERDPAIDALPDAAAPERFAAGCTADRAEDCFLEGYEWQRRAAQSGTAPRDESAAPLQRNAAAALERGCALGSARACAWLGSAVELGIGAEEDPARAAAAYGRACELGWTDGCRDAAAIYESGRRGRVESLRPRPEPAGPVPDVPRDLRRAIALDERACALGSSDACFIAARLLADEESVRDDARALALFARLCGDGIALACTRAAALDPSGAAEYRRRACIFGGDAACG